MVKTTTDLTQLYALRDRLLELNQRAPQLIAPNTIADIRKKTARGRSPEGEKYDEYSRGYLSTRRAYGRPLKPVDLNLTGQTLQGLNLQGNVITVRAEDILKAYVHNFGIGKQPERRFLDVGPDTNETNEKILAKEISKIKIS